MRYFDSNHHTVMNSIREVYAKTRLGFVIQCNLLVKVYPSLSEGIEIVGVFSKSNSYSTNKNVLLADSVTGEIYGLTLSSYENFGIHPAICYGNELNTAKVNLLQLFPLITKIEDLVTKNINFSSQMLDTEVIFANHIYQKNNLGGIGYPTKKEQAFKKYHVKIEVSEVMTYDTEGFSVIAVSFEEANFIRKEGTRGTLISEKDEADQTNKNNVTSFNSNRSLTHRQDSKKSRRSLSVDREASMNEQEIEEMNLKAEKERKLKEKKQMLKVKVVPLRIKMLYLMTSLTMLLCYCFQSFFLAWKIRIDSLLTESLNSIRHIKKRESILPDIAYDVMRVNDIHLYAPLTQQQSPGCFPSRCKEQLGLQDGALQAVRLSDRAGLLDPQKILLNSRAAVRRLRLHLHRQAERQDPSVSHRHGLQDNRLSREHLPRAADAADDPPLRHNHHESAAALLHHRGELPEPVPRRAGGRRADLQR